MKTLRRTGQRLLGWPKDYVMVSGSILPAEDNRRCGPEFTDNAYYLQSAEAEAKRLAAELGCDGSSRVVDIGCGQGRLPIGILRVIGELDYTGIDVHRRSIGWCKRHIQRHHPTFRFSRLNVANERYNKKGAAMGDRFRFELPDKSADIIYLYSVFSHMREEDMRLYLREFVRILDDGGNVFFTSFAERDVPDFSINPDDYAVKCSGPLHIVRYEQDYLFSILDEVGFAVDRFSHGTETDGQSAVYLSKKT